MAIFGVMSPECINYAQYITIILYKGQEGKNLQFLEEIFSYILIFGRNQIEIIVKLGVQKHRGSEKTALRNIGRGKSKKRAKNVPKYVIISIQYGNNSKFFLAIGDIGYSYEVRMTGEDHGKVGKVTGF